MQTSVVLLIVLSWSGFVPSGSVAEEVEVIKDDPLFRRLVSQIWSVHRSNLKDNSTLYGTQIDPLDLDSMMDEPIEIHTSQPVAFGSINSVAIMEGLQVHGLASMALSKSHVIRDKNLTEFDMEVKFQFSRLFINGTYRVSGSIPFSTIVYQLPGFFLCT